MDFVALSHGVRCVRVEKSNEQFAARLFGHGVRMSMSIFSVFQLLQTITGVQPG